MTGPNAIVTALRAPSQEADASFRFRRYLFPPESKKESSFSEEKEAKRLFPFVAVSLDLRASNGKKFFGSFFQKRTILP